MARAVVAGHHLKPAHWLAFSHGLPHAFSHGLPRLSDDAHQAYEEHLLERLQSFPQPPENQDLASLMVPRDVDMSVDGLRGLPWTHELRHDAESVFWLLVWWAIHLRSPRDNPNSHGPSQIRRDTYELLVGVGPAMGKDNRVYFMAELAEGQSWLDPEYQELEPLFQQMARQLDGDLYWAKYGDPKEMNDSEYLHEALQRIIFNFLMEHRTKPFMELDKHSLHREVEPQYRLHAELQVTPFTGKRTHSTMAGESESEVSRVSHLSSPALMRTTCSCRRRSAQGSFLRHIGRLCSLESQWVLTTMVNILVETDWGRTGWVN